MRGRRVVSLGHIGSELSARSAFEFDLEDKEPSGLLAHHCVETGRTISSRAGVEMYPVDGANWYAYFAYRCGEHEKSFELFILSVSMVRG